MKSTASCAHSCPEPRPAIQLTPLGLTLQSAFLSLPSDQLVCWSRTQPLKLPGREELPTRLRGPRDPAEQVRCDLSLLP